MSGTESRVPRFYLRVEYPGAGDIFSPPINHPPFGRLLYRAFKVLSAFYRLFLEFKLSSFLGKWPHDWIHPSSNALDS